MAALQDRDIKILKFILHYKYTCTQHIYENFFSGLSKVALHYVLKRLLKQKLIESQYFPRTKNISLGNLLYLTPKGATCLANELKTTPDEIGYRKIMNPIQSINHYYHRKKLIDFRINLDKDIKQHFPQFTIKHITTDAEREYRGGKQVISTNLTTKDGKVTVIPDIFFVLQNIEKNTEAFFVVEIDTAKETIGGKFDIVRNNSLVSKYTRYEKIYNDGNWKKIADTSAKAIGILTVTETETHVATALKQAAKHLKYHKLFLFSTHDLIERQGVLRSANWIRFDSSERKVSIFT